MGTKSRHGSARHPDEIEPAQPRDGVLVAFGKAKGMRGVIKQYVQNAQKRTEEQGKQRIRFCHVANEQGVEDLRFALNEAGVEYVDEGSSPCGATVATHLGLGALGISFAPAEA